MQTNAAGSSSHDLTRCPVSLTCIDLAWTLDFQPGQFISLNSHRRAASDDVPIRLPRRPVNEHSYVVFNRVDHGPGSTFLFGLKLGVRSVQGPAGSFVCATMRHVCCLSRPARGLPRSGLYIPCFAKAMPRVVTLLWVSEPSRICTIRKSCANWRPDIPCFTIIIRCLVPIGMDRSDWSRDRAGAETYQDGGQPRRVSLRKRRHDQGRDRLSPARKASARSIVRSGTTKKEAS